MGQLWDREPPLSKPDPPASQGETLVVIRFSGPAQDRALTLHSDGFSYSGMDVVEIESKKGRTQWIDAGF